MKIDQYGSIVMERDGMPGDLGDSCAETGRYVVLTNSVFCWNKETQTNVFLDLDQFISPSGFLRHPQAPVGWREDDFTSDQMVYLLMASYLRNLELFNFIFNNLNLMTKPKSIDVHALEGRHHNVLALSQLAQMLINKFPWRWDDSNRTKGKLWRFVSSGDMTVSYMTVYIAMIFLKRVGITWPQKFFVKDLYLKKAKAYYADQPNSKWFTDLFDEANL